MAISFFRVVPETTVAVVIILRVRQQGVFKSTPGSNLFLHKLQHQGGNQISVFSGIIYFLFYFLRIYGRFPVAHQNMLRDTI